MGTIAFLDIEASGLEPDDLPVEIAYVLVDDETLAVGAEVAMLIAPAEDCTDNGWNPVAESMHGLSREFLAGEGASAAAVCARVEADLAGIPVFSDAPLMDVNWLGILFEYHDANPTIGLRDTRAAFEPLLAELPADERKALSILAWATAETAHPVRHRALPDALRQRDAFLWLARYIRERRTT